MLLDKKIPVSYLVRKIKVDLIIVTIFSALTYFLHFNYKIFDLPASIPAFLGTAISLLLSFKLGQSYDRWWEARKIWGAIVNDSRTLVIQALNFSKQGSENDCHLLIYEIAHRQIAWVYALGNKLRGVPFKDEIKSLISSKEWNSLSEHDNVPLGMMNNHANDVRELLKAGQINEFHQSRMDETIRDLVASMGKAERIKNTVFPVTYRIFLHFFIYIFIFMLSIVLVESLDYFSIPILVIISTPFFLLEKTAKYLQDPFDNEPTDTPMTAIARTIEINIRQLMKEDISPLKKPVDTFYQM